MKGMNLFLKNNDVMRIDYVLKDHFNPFVQGFVSFFKLLNENDYNFKKNIKISDCEDCDIYILNMDMERKIFNSKIVFITAQKKYSSKEYFFPYLKNCWDRDADLLVDKKNGDYFSLDKKYHCVAMFRTTTEYRKNLIKNHLTKIKDVCDVVIIDNVKHKINIDPVDMPFIEDMQYVMSKSKFCLCPPGFIPETYRFSEALKNNCIPLEFGDFCNRIENFSLKYFINIDKLEKVLDLEFYYNDLYRVKKNIEINSLKRYVCGILREHDI